MRLPATSAFLSWRKTVTLTEQGEQVFSRMVDHLKTYESQIKEGKVKAEVLLPPPLVMSYARPVSLKHPVASKEKMVRNLRALTVETMMSVYMDLLSTYWIKE